MKSLEIATQAHFPPKCYFLTKSPTAAPQRYKHRHNCIYLSVTDIYQCTKILASHDLKSSTRGINFVIGAIDADWKTLYNELMQSKYPKH